MLCGRIQGFCVFVLIGHPRPVTCGSSWFCTCSASFILVFTFYAVFTDTLNIMVQYCIHQRMISSISVKFYPFSSLITPSFGWNCIFMVYIPIFFYLNGIQVYGIFQCLNSFCLSWHIVNILLSILYIRYCLYCEILCYSFPFRHRFNLSLRIHGIFLRLHVWTNSCETAFMILFASCSGSSDTVDNTLNLEFFVFTFLVVSDIVFWVLQ